jgi:hypothetical protein
MDIVVTSGCVQEGVAFSQLLYPNVMHSFSKITSWHIYPFNVAKLMQIPRKED